MSGCRRGLRPGLRVSALKMSRTLSGSWSTERLEGTCICELRCLRAAMDDTWSLSIVRQAIVAAKLQNSRKVVDRWSRDEKNARRD